MPDHPPAPADAPAELRCRSCNCAHFYPLSRQPFGDGKVRVRKECRHCGRVLTFTEKQP